MLRSNGTNLAEKRLPYSPSAGDRLTGPRRLGRFLALWLMVAAGPMLGACSYKLGGMFGSDKADSADVTGSVSHAPMTHAPRRDAENIPEPDMAYARAAAVDVIARGRKDASQSWENPGTGARGTVTPLASTSAAEGGNCRDFLASYVQGQQEAWWQGEACQFGSGRWEVRSMKPWKRS